MFENINVNDYDFYFELNRCVFMIDCLKPEIQFELKNDEISIKYKNQPMELDKFIYFVNINIAQDIYKIVAQSNLKNSYCYFRYLFGNISEIIKTIENMKIYLKYLPVD